MDKELEDWIDECLRNDSFPDKSAAIEFCVGFTREFAMQLDLNRKNLPLGMPATWAKDKGVVGDCIEALRQKLEQDGEKIDPVPLFGGKC